MIKSKIVSIILVIVNVLYMLTITLYKNPFVYNFSMYTNTIKGYILVIILCVLLGINLLNVTYLLNKKYSFIAFFGPIIGGLLPFNIDNRDFLSNLHEILAYVSLFSVLFITFTNINKFKLYDYKKANLLEKIFIIIFILDGFIYLKLFGVTSIQEFILLTTSLLIHLYMYLKFFVL